MTSSKRPDLRPYFRARIDHHVHGMRSTISAQLPHEVVRVQGSVEDSVITVTMRDGTEWRWSGGQYARRKVNGCYAPLMPRAID